MGEITNLKKILFVSLLSVAAICRIAAGGNIYVDADANGANNGSSWTDAYNFLQDALAAASSGDQIWVAQGMYKPDQGSGITPGNRGASFRLINGVKIKGGYAGFGEPDPNAWDVELYETILSGDLNGDDGPDFTNNYENSYHVVNGSGRNRTAMLEGFIITAGNADGTYPACNGGGIYNVYGGSPTVANCIFKKNSASAYGGGVYIFMDSHPMLSHCTFIGNSTNSGGGSCSRTGCAPILSNCVFSGNSATSKGGGIWNEGSLTLIGCTFNGNSGKGGTGGLWDFFGRAALINCVLWGNIGNVTGESAQIQNYSSYIGDTDIDYCCIEGWTGTYGGVGNIGEDPFFVDADGGDNVFGTEDDNPRLLPESSCLDAGDNDSVPDDTLDLDGDGNTAELIPFDADRNQRFIDEPNVPDTGNGAPPIVDIGAYESINQGFLLSTESVTITEGETAAFTVVLAMNPGTTVEVTVYHESGDPDITVQSGASLTFNPSNYSTPQSVTIAAAEDKDNLHGSTLIQIIAEGFAAAGVSVTEQDNDPIPTVLYVDADADAPGLNDGVSWEDAYIDLQDAIRIALDFHHVREIRIAEGIYRPANPRGSRGAYFRLVNGVAIKGGYAGYGQPDPNARDIELYKTILSGDLNGNDVEVEDPADLYFEPTRSDNSWNVVKGSGTNETAVLDGFTITGGDSGSGGGMYNDSGSPTLTFCTFRANSVCWDGCSGGAMTNRNSHPILTNCNFIGNAGALGGGMYNYMSSPMLTNCAFIGNKAGGPWSEGGSGGAMKNFHSSPTLINCVFIGNSATEFGGAIESGGDTASNPTLINCTIVGNMAEEGGGAILQESGTLTLTNCILWNNTAPIATMVYLEHGYQVNAIVNISYSDIEGWQSGFHIEEGCTLNWGEGNIDADPRFALPGYWGNVNDPNIIVEPDDPNAMWFDGDYHLKSRAGRWDPNSETWVQDAVASPCIDAGNPNSDWTSELWPHGRRINMGAYGGTPEASMSGNVVDFNIDGWVDDRDLKLLIDKWLYEDLLLPEDLSGDGIVSFVDFAIYTRILGLPSPAGNPNPADGATSVDLDADLSWKAGLGATSHDVYFGTSSPPPFIGNQTDTIYDPGTMDYDTMYYWRIDEVGAYGTTIGLAWSFTTITSPPP